jgi:transcriptional regulator with XRE-family HTH domain
MAEMKVGSDPDAADSAKLGASRFGELGTRIARLRIEKGWERLGLAEKLGVSRDRLSKWERGENAPPHEILVSLAILFEVTLDELVTGKPWAGEGHNAELEDFLAAAVEMLRRFRRNPTLAFAGLPRTSKELGVDPDG